MFIDEINLQKLNRITKTIKILIFRLMILNNTVHGYKIPEVMEYSSECCNFSSRTN
jgi:hypothetical protein